MSTTSLPGDPSSATTPWMMALNAMAAASMNSHISTGWAGFSPRPTSTTRVSRLACTAETARNGSQPPTAIFQAGALEARARWVMGRMAWTSMKMPIHRARVRKNGASPAP